MRSASAPCAVFDVASSLIAARSACPGRYRGCPRRLAPGNVSSVWVEDRVAVVALNVVSVPVATQCQVPDHNQPVPALPRCPTLRRHLMKVHEVRLEFCAMVGSMERAREVELVPLRSRHRPASSSKLVGLPRDRALLKECLRYSLVRRSLSHQHPNGSF